jgi:hypothetical protein
VSAILTRGCLNKCQDESRSSAHTSNLTLSTTNSSSHYGLCPPKHFRLSCLVQLLLLRSFARSHGVPLTVDTLQRVKSNCSVGHPGLSILLWRGIASHQTINNRHLIQFYRQKRSLPYARRLLFVCGRWRLRQFSIANLAADSRPRHITPYTREQQSSTLRRHYDV